MRRPFRPGHLMAIAGLCGGLAVWLAATTRERAAAGVAPWRQPAALRAAAPFPRTVEGTAVGRAPQRIVAASVLSAEVLLEIAPRERIAGVIFLAADARYSEVAALAATLPVVGQSPERLIAARPDLVVVDEFTRAEVPILLGTVGISVVRTRAVRDFDDVADNLRLLGWATGCDAAAEELVAAMRRRQAALAAHAGEVAGYRVMNLNGDLDTYGGRSLLDAAIRAAGAHNLPAEQGVGGYQKLDVETVLSWRPDALVVGVEPGERPNAVPARWLQQHAGLRLLPCVQQGHVVYLSNSLLGSTSHRSIEVAASIQQQLLAWGPR